MTIDGDDSTRRTVAGGIHADAEVIRSLGVIKQETMRLPGGYFMDMFISPAGSEPVRVCVDILPLGDAHNLPTFSLMFDQAGIEVEMDDSAESDDECAMIGVHNNIPDAFATIHSRLVAWFADREIVPAGNYDIEFATNVRENIARDVRVDMRRCTVETVAANMAEIDALFENARATREARQAA